MYVDENAPEQEVETIAEEAEDRVRALQDEKARADKYLSNWQRTEADFDNYRKRMEQEKGETVKFANTSLILSVLPVLDDLERAVKALPENLEGDPWAEGVRLIQRKMKSTLEGYGVTEIEAESRDFNPYVHEAVARADGEEGKVLEVVQKGYKFHDRVIRPAFVVVGQGEKVEKQDE
jgi:molecular chaperone GrpE